MDRKMTVLQADILLGDLVSENLHKEINDLHEMFSDTEEWLLFLTAAPNSQPKKRFPMTPSDVSRTRKRLKVDTIIESVEENEVTPLPESVPVQPLEPVRRGSRTAFKLASLKMKEPNLTHKLRRPGNSIPEEDATSQVLPPKRARKGKSNMPKADVTMTTPESSFVSARDSLTSDLCKGLKVDPMETKDDIVMKKVQSTKISTFDNCTKKSSLRVKTVTVTRSSKRVTKQLIKTVVESPARCMVTRKSSTDENTCSQTSDSDDNIPIINLVSKAKPEKTESLTTKRRTKILTPNAGNAWQQNVSISGTKAAETEADNAIKKRGEKAAESGLINCEKSKSLVQMQPCEAAPAEVTSVVEEHSETKVKNFRPALSNATNRITPEATRNLVNRHFEPISVKKRIEAIEHDRFVEPVAAVKPDVPVRMTRTKVKQMMASLIAVTSLPDKKLTRNIETSHLLKIARKSLLRANKISLAKERSKVELQKSVEKENTSPPNGAKTCLSQSIHSTNNKNRTTPNSYVHPSRLLAHMSTSQHLSTARKNRTTPHSNVHPSRLLAQMSTSSQPLVNLSSNISTFLPKTKVVSAAEKAEEKRKEERRQRRENKDDAVLKKKALIEDRTEQQRKKREEKERNVLAQKALKEREMAEMKMRIEKENEEKARLVQEREEMLKKEILRKKEEAKQKAAKIEERRVRQEAERLQALKLQEEEQQKLLAQKKKEQEDAERQHAKRMLEEKERKEKEAAQKEAALKLEKQNQIKNVPPTKTLDATFDVEKPILIAASKYDYPLLDLSKGNDSDFSDAEEEVIPSWAQRQALGRNLKISSGIPIKAILCYFGSKPTTPDLNEIFPNRRNKHVRSSSAQWKTPPRCSMVPNIL